MDSRRGMGRRSGDAGAVPPTKGKKRCLSCRCYYYLADLQSIGSFTLYFGGFGARLAEINRAWRAKHAVIECPFLQR